ncbi:MAG: glycosyltransferase family 39 protein, partial [Chloroflexi bacterium]|nr:glycosyltransferase family 39 protein [Chloroflexota bacterium]
MLHSLVLLAILTVAFAMRVTDLEGARSNFPDLFDEGIRVEQLFLMSQGFRPYRDIYAAQGPLLLDTLYPFYRLFGETLGAVRLGVGLLSLVGLVGAYLVARELGGRFGGLLACGLLALSPPYLEGSRLALAEVPSIAPALLALAFALRYRGGGSRRWLVASAVFFAVSLLLKPMILPVGVAIGLVLLGRPYSGRPPYPPKLGGVGGARSGPDLAVHAFVVAAVIAVVVVAMGPREVFEQLVLYRAGATGASVWDARANWKEAVQGPVGAQPSLYVLAVVGAILLLVRTGWRGAPLVAWPLATFALLFFYTPLHPKHLVYLAPPAAVLAGAGLGAALRGVGRDVRIARWPAPESALVRSSVAAAAAFLLVWNVATVQPALARGVQVGVSEDDLDLHVFDDEVARTLRALTSPDEFILTDHPYLAFLARRMVPPELVDPSRGRTRAGTLTDEVAARSATERDTRVVLFWADRLRRLGRFNAWVEQRYRPVASFGTRVARSRFGKDRTVYLRNDADFDAARSALV